MTAQQRHDAIRSIARDPNISDAEALRRIARITPEEQTLKAEIRLLRMGPCTPRGFERE